MSPTYQLLLMHTRARHQVVERDTMKQYIWMKVIAGGLALAALLYGISIMDADPTLRVVQRVSMADIEAGKMPRDGQKVLVTDVWLLPTWVVEYSHSRKRGDHAHVHIGVGSRATFDRAAAGEVTDVKLWMRLPQDYKTREGASAAMNRDDLYGRAQNRDGVINELPSSVRENITNGGQWTSKATMRLEDGAPPKAISHFDAPWNGVPPRLRSQASLKKSAASQAATSSSASAPAATKPTPSPSVLGVAPSSRRIVALDVHWPPLVMFSRTLLGSSLMTPSRFCARP